jgi:hypothetical protein
VDWVSVRASNAERRPRSPAANSGGIDAKYTNPKRQPVRRISNTRSFAMNLPETLLKSLAIATTVVGIGGCIPESMRKRPTEIPAKGVVTPTEPTDPAQCPTDSCPACGRG